MRTYVIQNDADLEAAEKYILDRAQQTENDPAFEEKNAAVREILEAVRTRGDAAVSEFTERFDGVALTPDQFEVTDKEIDKAFDEAGADLITALERAHENIRAFHIKNMRQSWEETSDDGTVLGQRVSPIESAGVYVPGGKAFYPSSVLMNIVPAKAAGVENVIMVSPPSYQGGLHPLVLAAAKIAGATRIYRIGGAQSVAALAYGTATIQAVTKITGPGNVYVTLAKRIASSVCDIDKEAGPSEVVVVADDKADAGRAAIELLCQAEHDEEAVTSLVVLSQDKANAARTEIETLLPTLKRAEIIKHALNAQGAVFVVRNLDEAAALTNTIAPEHLSLQVADPRALFDKIRNAGAVMLGGGTPVAVGDYYAGPNHILPTGRRARFASALTVDDFQKVTNYINYSPSRLAAAANDICLLAYAEELDAHARAVEMRL